MYDLLYDKCIGPMPYLHEFMPVLDEQIADADTTGPHLFNTNDEVNFCSSFKHQYLKCTNIFC